MTKLLRLADGGRKELRNSSSLSSASTSANENTSNFHSAMLHHNHKLVHAQSVPLTHAQYRSLSYQSSSPPALSLHKDMKDSLVLSEQPRHARFDFPPVTPGPKVHADPPKSLGDVVRPISWKYCDYPVAPTHLLSSSTAEALDKQIREVLKREHIAYVVETRDSLQYVCSKTVDSAVYNFTILISSLLKTCQKVLNNKFVVEVLRNRNSGFCEPLTWMHLTGVLLGGLDENKGDKESVAQAEEEPLSLKADWKAPSSQFEFNPVESFLQIFEHTPPNVENEGMAEMLLISSQNLVASGDGVELPEAGLDRMQGLLYQGSTHFKRCACLIVEALALGGSLKAADEERVNTMFRELLRTLFLYDDETQVELKLAAMKALNSLKEKVKPCGTDRSLLSKAVYRYQAFEDNRLQAEASRLANIYGVRPAGVLECH